MAKRKSTNKEKDFTMPVSGFNRLWDMGYDVGGGSNGRPSKPYNQVDWVWICVNKIIDVAKSIQLVLSNQNEDIIETGEAYDLLFNNPKMPLSTFMRETVGYSALFREVYWIFPDKENIRPTNIIVAGPNTCRPEIVQGEIVGYKLTTANGTQVPLFTEDVWPIINFNPDRSFRGAGPLDSGKLTISSSHQATQYNEACLGNGARIGTMLIAPAGVKLDDPEKQYLKAQFDSVHKGARNAGKTFLATGGLDVKTIGQTMVELQMLDLRKYDAATICSLFGVPQELVNLNSEAQYAHGPAAQRFIMYTIAPLLADIAEHISTGILTNFRFKDYPGVAQEKSKSYTGSRLSLRRKASYRQLKIKAMQSNQKLFAWFDVESHPAVQEMERDKAEKVMKFCQYGVPLNDVITVYDLPFEKVPWGDDWWIGMGQVPARFTLEAGTEGLTGPSLPEGGEEAGDEPKPAADGKSKAIEADIEKADEAQRLRIWKNWIVSWAGIEREYSEALRKFFLRQQRELLDKLVKELPAQKDINKAEPDEVVARIVFDMKKENDKLRIINQTFFDKASELGIRQVASEVGMSADTISQFVDSTKRNAAIRHALAVQSKLINGVNKTTQSQIANQLKTGLESGEGLNDLTSRIKKVLGTNRQRALSIARTQTAGAIGSGRHTAMKESGIEVKIWLDSHDDHVRESHKDAGKRYAKGIPIDQPFVIGGDFLMHPAEAGGSAANVINCRCVELAGKANENKAVIFTRYAGIKFYSYEDMCKAVA